MIEASSTNTSTIKSIKKHCNLSRKAERMPNMRKFIRETQELNTCLQFANILLSLNYTHIDSMDHSPKIVDS